MRPIGEDPRFAAAGAAAFAVSVLHAASPAAATASYENGVFRYRAQSGDRASGFEYCPAHRKIAGSARASRRSKRPAVGVCGEGAKARAVDREVGAVRAGRRDERRQ